MIMAKNFEIVEIPLRDLKEDPLNLRRHGVENIEMIKKSLRENAQYKPLVVDRATNIVKIGNGRLSAMRELGWRTALCVLVDFDLFEGIEVLDNRLNELSQWKDPRLDDWLLNDKGVDWWGVDAAKSHELLKSELKRDRKERKGEGGKARGGAPRKKKVYLCPCCGKPIRKVQTVLL